jgi:hypothetical protein
LLGGTWFGHRKKAHYARWFAEGAREIDNSRGPVVLTVQTNAERGGTRACAVWHVTLEGAAAANVPLPGEIELLMLDSVVAAPRRNSQLSYKVLSTPAFEGLVVRIAGPQG